MRDEIHVWRADLEAVSSQRELYERTLSPDEQVRARRFYFGQDRNRFVARRGILRKLLANYLSLQANEVQFNYQTYGKPALGPHYGERALEFSCSWSAAMGIYAFCIDSEIGVDLERIRECPDMIEVAESFFTRAEKTLILSTPQRKAKELFYTCWTCKEAFVKALGQGLRYPLYEFEVPLAEEEGEAFGSLRGNRAEIKGWSILKFKPAPNFLAALAIRKGPWKVSWWQFQGQETSGRLKVLTIGC
jgi:4'-phosphopantetheinyl transferase